MIQRTSYFLLLVCLMVCGLGWAAGYRAFTLDASGIAASGMVFLFMQYRTEVGVWKGSLLCLSISILLLVHGLMVAIGTPGDDPILIIERVDDMVGIVILIGFCVFAGYATVRNFLLFSSARSSKSEGERVDAGESMRCEG